MSSVGTDDALRVEIDDFMRDSARHLRESWGRGASLVLTVGGEPVASVDTFEDLEAAWARIQEHRHRSG